MTSNSRATLRQWPMEMVDHMVNDKIAGKSYQAIYDQYIEPNQGTPGFPPMSKTVMQKFIKTEVEMTMSLKGQRDREEHKKSLKAYGSREMGRAIIMDDRVGRLTATEEFVTQSRINLMVFLDKQIQKIAYELDQGQVIGEDGETKPIGHNTKSNYYSDLTRTANQIRQTLQDIAKPLGMDFRDHKEMNTQIDILKDFKEIVLEIIDKMDKMFEFPEGDSLKSVFSSMLVDELRERKVLARSITISDSRNLESL